MKTALIFSFVVWMMYIAGGKLKCYRRFRFFEMEHVQSDKFSEKRFLIVFVVFKTTTLYKTQKEKIRHNLSQVYFFACAKSKK